MIYDTTPEKDYVTIRDFPHRSIVKLAAALAGGAFLFLLIFNLLMWLVGMPGPFLWFGSESRLIHVLGASFATSASVFVSSMFGLVALKALSLIDFFNFRLKVR